MVGTAAVLAAAILVPAAAFAQADPGGDRRRLEYVEPDVFRMGGAELRFFRRSGRVAGYTYEGGRVRGVRFERLDGSG